MVGVPATFKWGPILVIQLGEPNRMTIASAEIRIIGVVSMQQYRQTIKPISTVVTSDGLELVTAIGGRERQQVVAAAATGVNRRGGRAARRGR